MQRTLGGLLLAASLLGTTPECVGQCRLPGIPVDSITCKVTYRGSVHATGTPQSALYYRARVWAVTHFSTGKEAVQFDESAHSTLIIQGYTRYTNGFTGPEIWRTITLTVKENCCDYKITSFLYVIPHNALAKQGSVEQLLKTELTYSQSPKLTKGYQQLQKAIQETTKAEIIDLQQGLLAL